MAVRVEHRATVDRAMAARTALRATGVAAPRVAVDTIQCPVAVDITRVAVVAAAPGAEVVDTPAVAVAIRVVVAAIPAAIAKKLGDSMSPREAAT